VKRRKYFVDNGKSIVVDIGIGGLEQNFVG
jgi:hypothetical protein